MPFRPSTWDYRRRDKRHRTRGVSRTCVPHTAIVISTPRSAKAPVSTLYPYLLDTAEAARSSACRVWGACLPRPGGAGGTGLQHRVDVGEKSQMQAIEASGNGPPWDPRDLLQALAVVYELIALVSHEAAAAAAGLMAWALRWVLDQQV